MDGLSKPQKLTDRTGRTKPDLAGSQACQPPPFGLISFPIVIVFLYLFFFFFKKKKDRETMFRSRYSESSSGQGAGR